MDSCYMHAFIVYFCDDALLPLIRIYLCVIILRFFVISYSRVPKYNRNFACFPNVYVHMFLLSNSYIHTFRGLFDE